MKMAISLIKAVELEALGERRDLWHVYSGRSSVRPLARMRIQTLS